MRVVITATDFAVPAGTELEVGHEIPAAFRGKCRVVPYRDPLDHDGDGRKGGSLPKVKRESPRG